MHLTALLCTFFFFLCLLCSYNALICIFMHLSALSCTYLFFLCLPSSYYTLICSFMHLSFRVMPSLLFDSTNWNYTPCSQKLNTMIRAPVVIPHVFVVWQNLVVNSSGFRLVNFHQKLALHENGVVFPKQFNDDIRTSLAVSFDNIWHRQK